MLKQARWLAVIIISLISATAAPAEPPPTVELKAGILEGSRFGASPDDAAFLGVPYAAPPVKELRWKPPKPVEPWQGARAATRFGSPCSQLPAGWFPYIEGSEDCLYLNVWTAQLSGTAKQPVIVYLHGGSNTSGYSQMTPLGPALAPLGVVVVSANYRLGPFGFFAHRALTAESEHRSSGNYGLLDQLQAMRWVQDNIARFGGDPARVTVMGQSAGAVDICLLMASPLAAGLFSRAILESGECQSTFNEELRKPVAYNSISGSGEQEGERLAAGLGITGKKDVLQELRSISSSAILKAWGADRRAHTGAIVDGWVVPEQPAAIFARGQQMHVPILIGSNLNEATVFGPGPATLAEYIEGLRRDTGKYSGEELKTWPAQSDAEVRTQHLKRQADWFAYGAASMAQAMKRAGEKAYLYCFSYAETGKRANLGAYHGEELAFLSNSFPDDWEHGGGGGDDDRLGRLMRGYWTQFAKAGDPNAPGTPDWAAYDSSAADQCFELGRRVGARPVDGTVRVLGRIMDEIFAETAPHRTF